MDKMKKGISPLIAVVLLIVIGIGLIAIVVPMVRQPTEKTMKEASETTSRILGCKDIKFDVDRICKGGDNWGPGTNNIWVVIENLKNVEIYNFITKINSNENIETSYPWQCGIRSGGCSELQQIGCSINCPFIVKLQHYESIAIRLEANILSKIPENEITTIDVIPVLVNENKLDNCNDAAKKIIVNGVLNSC